MPTEWTNYIEVDGTQKTYFCQQCKKPNAVMKRRFVNEPSGSHKEYRIECSCGNKSSVHWRRSLAEQVFTAVRKD